MFDKTVQRAINSSVQTADIHKLKPITGTDGGWDMWGVIPHAEIVSSWGQRRRDRELRTLSYATHNGLFQGAIAALVMRVQSTPWEVKGGRNLARYYQDMLQASDFHDWETWLARMLWDFLTQDFGAVTEIIGTGNASKRISGRVLGIAHMDSLSCYATKNNDFPIIYWNEEDNAMHQMHQTRVHRLTDMVSPQRRAYGTGISALSRYLSDANVDILLGRHDNEMLSDLPPAGLLAVSGMTEGQWNSAVSLYESDRRADGQQTFRGTMVLHAIDPTNPLKVETIPFSTLPANFDSFKFVEMHVNKLALALGVDPQDIWPLSGQALGTGTQSVILHSKAQGKMFGRVLQMVTRFLNRKVLPEGLEFQFKFKDTEEDSERANTAKIWVDIANSAAFLNDEEKRKLVAQEVEPIRDVITDENGEVVALPDDDPKTDEQEVIAPDDNPLAAVADPTAVQANLASEDNPANASDDERPAKGAVPPQLQGKQLSNGTAARVGGELHTDRSGRGLHLSGQKDFSATKDAFVSDVAASISDASNAVITPGAFAIRVRASLSKFGKAAYLDGLNDGGVEADTLEGDDSDTYATILAEQSGYVTDARRGITDFSGDAESRAQLWGNKSLELFYQAGVVSADKNGMYEWVYGDTEHCADCLRLNGQKHRMKDWIAEDWMPKSDTLECHGFRCQCELKKTTGRAKGSY